MQSRAVEMTRVLLWKGITFIIIIIIIIIINIIIINITGSLARKRGSRGLASSSSLSARDSATAYLTNERRVLRLLTNQRPVPGGLELEAREVEVLEELHEPRQDAEVDHLVDGRVPLSRQELPDDRNENTAIQTF